MQVLLEAKQSIINLGIPQIIAAILQEKYGKMAYTIARWYKELQFSYSQKDKDWWRTMIHGFNKPTIVQIADLYEASERYLDGTTSFEEYNKIRDKLDFEKIKPDQKPNLESLKRYIVEQFFSENFFSSNLIQDISKGKLKSIQPYAKLNFVDALEKYEEKKFFQDKEPVKTYSNGWKWVDAGAKCALVGKQMKNCGSTGVMGTDRDRTLMVLVDPSNNPHVISTYSPNDNKLSNVEGQASTGVKDEYVDYVIDLASILNAELDMSNNKSRFLRLKSAFKTEVTRLPVSGGGDEFFIIHMPFGQYYSEGYVTFPVNDFDKIVTKYDFATKLRLLFDYYGRSALVADNPWIPSKLKNVNQWNPASSFATESLRRFVNKVIQEVLREEALVPKRTNSKRT